MTYHEFLREVWKHVNTCGNPITGEAFDAAVLPALCRARHDIYLRLAEVHLQTVTEVLRFIENNWSPAEPVTRTPMHPVS